MHTLLSTPGLYAALEVLDGPVAALGRVSSPAQASLEGFAVVTKVFDAFVRVLYNLRATSLGAFHDFRRSEARAYAESHVLALRQLFKNPLPSLEVQVPIPDGMRGSFLETVDGLDGCLQRLKIADTLAAVEEYLAHYAKLEPAQYATLTLVTRQAAQRINKVTRTTMEEALRKLFDASHERTVPARAVIANAAELNRLHVRVLNFEQAYRDASAAAARIQTLEATVDGVIRDLGQLTTVDPRYVKELHGFVYVAATQLDLYGSVLAEMQRVEHNFVLALHAISEKNL